MKASIRAETNAGTTRFEVVSQREIRYATVHPEGYVFGKDDTTLQESVASRPALIVLDRNIERIYGNEIRSYVNDRLNCKGYAIVEPVESEKTLDQVERICAHAVNAGLPRDGVIIAVGGGVTLDIAGFAASIFRRGVSYIRIPTSLIGLIDVGVGIKQGVNFLDKKSILGAFYPAMVNINEPAFLATLPLRDLSAGIAEIIKIAVVRDEQLFTALELDIETLLEQRFQHPSIGREVILRAEYLMMDELHQNLFETDLRRLADFGHSFSPMIETATEYAVNHGEAVAVDMALSAAIAVVKGLCARRDVDRILRMLSAARLPLIHGVCTMDRLLKSLIDVRAHRAGDLNLIVPVEIGKAEFVQEVTPADLSAALAILVEEQQLHGGHTGGSWRDASTVRAVA